MEYPSLRCEKNVRVQFLSDMALAQAILWDHDINGHVGRRWRRLLEVSFSPLVQWANEMTPLLDGSWKCLSCGIALAVLIWLNATSKSEGGCDVWCPACRVYRGPCTNPLYVCFLPGWKIMSMQNGKASAVKSEQSHAGSKSCRRAQVGEGCKPELPWEFSLFQGSDDCPGRWRWNSSFVFYYMGLKTHLGMHLSGVLSKRYLKHLWIIVSFLFQLKVLHKSHLNLQRSLATPNLHSPENLLKRGGEGGPSLMTKPFVCKNSQMTQEFPVNVFGADPCVIQIGVCLFVTQSFSFIDILDILFEVPPFAQKMDWGYGHAEMYQRDTSLELQLVEISISPWFWMVYISISWAMQFSRDLGRAQRSCARTPWQRFLILTCSFPQNSSWKPFCDVQQALDGKHCSRKASVSLRRTG